MAKKIVTIALGILCVGLLTVILYSVITGWNVSLLPAENSAVSSVSPSSAMPKPGSSGKNEPSSKPAAPSKPEPEPSREASSEPVSEPAPESAAEPSPAPSQALASSQAASSQAPVSGTAQPSSSEAPSSSSQAASSAPPPSSSSQAASSAPPPSSSSQAASSAPPPSSSSQAASSETPPKPSVPAASSTSTKDNATLRETEAFTAKKGWLYITDQAIAITDFSLLTGGWRAVMYTDPDGDGAVTDFMNIEISGSASDPVVTMHWGQRYFHNGGETVDESGSSTAFKGPYSGGVIDALGSGRITLKDFVYDPGTGTEYAVGEYIWPDGVKGIIGLVR